MNSKCNNLLMKVSPNDEMIKKWSKVPINYMDDYGDEGDLSKKFLLNPVIFRLLGEINGKRILEVGCGQGYLCRLMAKRGAIVTGLEPSESMYKYAKEKEEKEKLGITYIQADLSKVENLEKDFDAVVTNMVFLDIPDYESAMKNCIKALRPGGDFVFSLTHPCFFLDDEYKKNGYIKISEYFEEYSTEQKFGDSFHRPLSKYLNLVIKEGCNICEVVEPQLSKELAKAYPELAKDLHVPTFIVIHAVKI